MSYQQARECFSENLSRIENSISDPMNWNLNSGLDALTESLEADVRQMKSRLSDIESLLRQQR